MKIMHVMGIIAGLAVVSAKAQEEGCDGPILVGGSTVNSCGPCSATEPHCPGSTTVRNDYYRCGGSGFTSCSSMNDTVGQSGMPCTLTSDYNALVILQLAYDDCLSDQYKYDPPRICTPPQFCQWNTCSAGTTGGTPIVAQVVYSLGNYTGCMIAKHQKSSSPSIVELALVILKRAG